MVGSSCATAYRENTAEEKSAETTSSEAASSKAASSKAASSKAASSKAASSEGTPSEAELNEQFTSEQLSETRLRAMEVRARQKLQDFIDYLNIIANPTLDSTFRKEAVQQAEQLFVDPQAKVNLSPDNQATEMLTVHRWLEALRHTQEPQSFVADEPVVIQPLTADENFQYRGTLAFTLLAGSTPTPTRTERQADVLVKKVYKEFGREKEWVWEMFLEDIE